MTTSPPRRGWARFGLVGLITTLLLALGAGVASAHVTVNPNSVTAGSYAKLTFRVPTESETASTVALQVTLPKDHPFPSVSVMQIPGWTPKVITTALNPPVVEGSFKLTEAVTSITWTADDGVGIKPEEFMEFAISVGPVPNVPSMQFPANQTYSDGSVVRWDQTRAPGTAEPAHPAPLLTITPAVASSDAVATPSGQAAAGPTVTGASEAYQSAVTVTSPDSTARVLSVIALILAALALLVAVLGVRRRPAPGGPPTRVRREPPSPPDPPQRPAAPTPPDPAP